MCLKFICLTLYLTERMLMVLCFMKVALRHGVSLDHALLEQNITNISLKSVVVGFSPSAKEVVNGTRITRSPLNDIVSKNITLVLENLLKNYESSQLPTHGKVQILYNVAPRTAAVKLNVFRTANTSHKLKRQPMAKKDANNFYIPLSIAGADIPTIVQTNILIRSMGPVSELDMEYSMDCYFRQYWRDQRLSFLGPIKSLSLSIKMLERIWRPDTYFYNGKNSYVHTITVPNKLLRISQDGDILYSMRLTIKAKCPMELKSFPMDRQSCPLIMGSYAYTSKDLVYQWQNEASVNFVPGMTLSQFDLISSPYRNLTLKRREGEFSVLQVSFNLQRHTGYFLIQVYVPCILIVVLSWVSFWIHREATSDRVGLGITTVLTLSTISLDSRTDLPKVRYATALDWFLLMSFFYCIATLLEFAGVHYFTKVGSGEIPVDEDDWEDCNESDEEIIGSTAADLTNIAHTNGDSGRRRRRSSIICPIYNNSSLHYENRKTSLTTNIQGPPPPPIRLTMERTTQTENKLPKWKQFLYCLKGDDKFRKQRQREAASSAGSQHGHMRHVNSVSLIDRAARILFPASFGFFNLFYWMAYFMTQENFKWGDTKLNPLNH